MSKSKQFHISYKTINGSQSSSMSINIYASTVAEAKAKFKESKKHDKRKIEIISVREV